MDREILGQVSGIVKSTGERIANPEATPEQLRLMARTLQISAESLLIEADKP